MDGRRWRSSLAPVLTAACLVAIACSPGASPPSPASGGGSSPTSGEASASAQLTGDLDVRVYGDWAFVQPAADAFMQLHPDLHIKIGGITDDELRHQALREFTSSEAPDVAAFTVGFELLSEWVRNEAVIPVDDAWEKAGLNGVVEDSIVKQLTLADGKRYTVPIDLAFYPQIFYNTDALAKAGVTLPTGSRAFNSIDEFNQVADKLTAAGYKPVIAAAGETYDIPLHHFLGAACGKDYLALAENWKATAPPDVPKYSEGCGLMAIKWYKDWVDRGYVTEGYMAGTYDQAVTLFETKAAIWVSGSWAPPSYKPPFAWEWGLLPPATPGGTVPVGVAIDSLVVPKGARNPNAAKAFIAFLVSKGQLEKGMGRVPARTDVDLNKVVGDIPLEVSTAEEYGKYELQPGWALVVPVSVFDAGRKAFEGLFDGSLTAEQAGGVLDSAVREYKASHP